MNKEFFVISGTKKEQKKWALKYLHVWFSNVFTFTATTTFIIIDVNKFSNVS